MICTVNIIICGEREDNSPAQFIIRRLSGVCYQSNSFFPYCQNLDFVVNSYITPNSKKCIDNSTAPNFSFGKKFFTIVIIW